MVIGRMAVTPGAIGKAAFLLLDLTATVTIFVMALFVGTCLVFRELSWSTAFLVLLTLDALTAEGGLLFSAKETVSVIAILFYTTLFTSVWVWLFMLGGVLWPLFTWLRGVLGVEKFPVGSAMAIGGVFGGLVVTVAGYVRMAALS